MMTAKRDNSARFDALVRCWDLVYIRLAEARHQLLIREGAEVRSEYSSFVFLRSRRCTVQLNDTPYLVQSAALFHMGRGQCLRLPAAQDVEYFQVSYQVELPQSAGCALTRLMVSEQPFDLPLHIRPRQAACFAVQFQRIVDLFRHAQQEDALLIKGMLYSIASAFFTELKAVRGSPITACEQARQHLEEHFRQPVSIQALADAVGMNRSSLYTQFMSALGLSPQQYLMRLRLDAAVRQLLQSTDALEQIALDCGLRDKSYFTRIFKSRYHVTPGRYREMHSMQEAAKRFPHMEPLPRTNLAGGYNGLLIENFGRVHRFATVPQRIVCLNYSSAEMCAALGAVEAIVGIAGAEEALEDCDAAFRQAIAHIPFLQDQSGLRSVPSFSDVCSWQPDLVIGTSYSFRVLEGVADTASFEGKCIHVYALSATCKLGATFEETYQDIENLGRILGVEQRAAVLIKGMRKEEEELRKRLQDVARPVRVFCFDGASGDKAITCGQSLENHLICAAGGQNIFADRQWQFTDVSWEEVAGEDPEVILVHRYYNGEDGENKRALIEKHPALRRTAAVRHNRIHVLGLKSVFPGIDNVLKARQLARLIHPACFQTE